MLFALLTLATLRPTFALLSNLHTDLVELLPDAHPAVLALRRVGPRQISSTNLVVILESPDATANHKLAEALRPQLTALVGRTFSEIQWQPETEVPTFLHHNRFLYADLHDLEQTETLLERVLAHRTSPLVVDLEGDPEAELRALRDRFASKLQAAGAAAPQPTPSPYFEHHPPARAGQPPTHYLGIMLWRRSDGLATLGDQDTLDTVAAMVARVNPTTFHPAMRVEYSGAIAMAVAEQRAVRDDLSFASTVCVCLVLLSILIFFRRIGVLLAVGAPAILGLLCALTLAHYTVGSLNANSAFLISIILGNGINSPIILLSRYGGARRAGLAVPHALQVALRTTLRGTLAAMAAASIAYGSLLLTTLRGLSQFGLIGGMGMLVVWALTFLLVPPLVVAGERLRPGSMTAAPPLWRAAFALLGRLTTRHPLVSALILTATVLALAAPALRFVRAPLDYSPSALRTDNPEVNRLWGIMYDLGMGNLGAGHIARDGVILVDRPDQADAVADALWAQDQALGDRRVLDAVRTLNKILPAQQADKLAVLGRIRTQLDRHRPHIDDSEWADLQGWRPPDDLHSLAVPDLPHRLRENFTEVDGTVGRFVGIDADPHRFNEDDGRDLIRLDRSLRVEALGKTWIAAATSTIFASMLEVIMRDGPKMVLCALAGVGLLLLALFGPRQVVLLLLPLSLGLFWLLGLLGLWGWRLNFLNFAALPITIGVGADYAANLWGRLRDDPQGPNATWAQTVAEAVADTGAAVSLCSLTTILGYSSLLLSRSRALQSFGRLANLGEVTCLLSALIALPCLALLLRYRRGPRA